MAGTSLSCDMNGGPDGLVLKSKQSIKQNYLDSYERP